MGDLRERLVAAKLAGTTTGNGYTFRSNENAADTAARTVAAWLRDQADTHRQRHDIIRADTLDAAADTIFGDQP